LVTELLSTLKDSPRLEVLLLIYGDPVMDISPGSHAVALDHLRMLEIGYWPSDKFEIISFLIVPLTAKVIVWSYCREHPLLPLPNAITRIFRSISHHWRNLSRFTHIVLVMDEPANKIAYTISASNSTLTLITHLRLNEFLPDLSSLPHVLEGFLICLPGVSWTVLLYMMHISTTYASAID
jgi:hypothetical protein